MTDSPLGLSLQSDWPNPVSRQLTRQDFQIPSPPALNWVNWMPAGVGEWPTPTINFALTPDVGQPVNPGIIPTPPPTVVVIDGHDSKRFEDHIKKGRKWREKQREDVISAYEALSGELPMLTNQMVEPYVAEPDADPGKAYSTKSIDFERLLRNTDRVQQLLEAYREMDDEEAILLL